ncbi:MAG: hypothetical protein ACTS22_09835 [Phycisphaerales bacterium]
MEARVHRKFAFGLALAAGLALPALGQDAQGDGRALDRNQQVGSGGINRPARPDFSAELRFRNAIVTGNAPNGLSFRGDIGYTADREFRGQLGSDDLFSFRRDSLYSGLSGVGIRGTDALQYQFALTTGNRPPRELAGSLALSRDLFTADVPAVASTSAQLSAGGVAAPSPTLSRIPADELEELSGAGMWKLRSPSAYTAERSLAESFVGSVTTGMGDTVGISASPLTGIRTIQPQTSPAAQAMRDRASQGVAAAVDTSAVPTAAIARAEPGVGYEGYLQRLEQAYPTAEGEAGGPASVSDRVREQNQRLQEFLLQLREPMAPEDDEAEPTADAMNDADRLRERFRELGIADATIEALRSEGLEIDDLVPAETGSRRSFYAMHMAEGRRLMAEGSYFAAEARFALALALREDDATAAIARVHAQLGAGLFLSAAVNLRETLNSNPVLVGASYADDLIPSEERLRVLADRLAAQARDGGPEGRSAALLLAYVGHHLGDDSLIERGLDRIDLEVQDPLSQLLRIVWLDDDGAADAEAEDSGP